MHLLAIQHGEVGILHPIQQNNFRVIHLAPHSFVDVLLGPPAHIYLFFSRVHARQTTRVDKQPIHMQ